MNIFYTTLISLLFTIIPITKIKFTKNNFIKKNKYNIIYILIIFIGCFIRLIYIDKYPIGFNQDEASIGYEAYSLLTNGIDRHGLSLPINFISWGSGQNVLYAYLSIPFIKLLGLNILSTRIVMSLIGCLTLLVLYIFSRNAFKDKHGIIFLLLFTILPWHIMKSRWALESNIFPDLIIYSLVLIYFGLKRKKKKYFILSSIILGISIYSYGTSYLLVPLFLIILYTYLIKIKEISFKEAIIYFFLTGLIALPMILYVIINFFDLNTLTIFNITIPKLYSNRMSTELIFNGNILKNLLLNIFNLLGLIIVGRDGTVFNSTIYFGIYYNLITIPLLIFGIYKSYKTKNKYIPIINILFIVSIIIGLLIKPNINRINTIWISLIFYIIYGIIILYKKYYKIYKIYITLFILSFILFIPYYFTNYKKEINNKTYYSLKESIDYANTLNYNKLYITNSINQPYIFYLFYNKINTNYFINNSIIKNKEESFHYVQEIDNVYFHYPSFMENNIVIISDKEHKHIYDSHCNYKEFDNYIVFDC